MGQAMACIGQQHTQWIMELRVNNVAVHFKINTGAEVSAISEATFHHLRNVKLQKSSNRLYSPCHLLQS